MYDFKMFLSNIKFYLKKKIEFIFILMYQKIKINIFIKKIIIINFVGIS